MRKKVVAFYDTLLYAIICGPMIVVTGILLFLLVTKGTSEWIYEHWYLVLAFAFTFAIPTGAIMLFRYYVVSYDSIYFHYFTFVKGWGKATNNIDTRWNQNVFIPEIKEVKIVKLSEEEKRTKIYFKHWFNKYLKISLNHGNPKYVYVGNYSNYQIKKIISLLNNK